MSENPLTPTMRGVCIIERIDQGGGYVAKEGHATSYTRRIECARKFPTWEAAEAHRCPENERIIRLSEILGMNP